MSKKTHKDKDKEIEALKQQLEELNQIKAKAEALEAEVASKTIEEVIVTVQPGLDLSKPTVDIPPQDYGTIMGCGHMSNTKKTKCHIPCGAINQSKPYFK